MSQPLRLDCESQQSAEASVLASFGCTQSALQAFLGDPSHLANYEANSRALPVDFKRFLYQRACETLGAPTLPTEFCWFHGTRVPLGTTFEEGILPLGQVAPSLQERLVAELEDPSARAAVQRAFANKGGNSFHFREKLTHAVHSGPYAILVREVADYANELGQHDYLRMPEIIEDLCEEVRAECGLDLLAIYEERWRPCTVKFVVPGGVSGEGGITAALAYLRALVLQGKPDTGAVCNFDGKNCAISPEWLLAVDFV